MSNILNLTQHPATPEQQSAGVIEPAAKKEVQQKLTFSSPPSEDELWERANQIADLAAQEKERLRESGQSVSAAMIGGMSALMPALAEALRQRDIEPLYAFSQREVKVVENADGTITKQNIFRHAGFVPAPKVSVGRHEAQLQPTTPAVNLTSFNLTEAQRRGLDFREISPEDRARINALGNFTDIPTPDEIDRRAAEIADIAAKYLSESPGGAALIAGAPYLAARVAEKLSERGITPVESFSVRRVVEKQQADGSVVKESVFDHAAYIANPAGGRAAFNLVRTQEQQNHNQQKERTGPVLSR